MKSPLFHLIFSSIAAAAANLLDSQNIQWGPCSKDGPRAAIYALARVKIECGVLAVPIDWTSPESEATYNISLLKIPALKGPAKGSIQFNFGGPGFGMEGLPPYAEVYQALTGGIYDLIAWDPRGVALEFQFNCATDNSSITQLVALQPDMSISERESRTGWAVGAANAGICKHLGNGNRTAEYIGTTFMARDIKRVSEAVDKDGLIRYWGISYGTTLGATIASMFPEKVDRMIINGIQNAKQFYYEWTDSELWTLLDKVVNFYFDACVDAGPELCALAAVTNRTGTEMARDFYEFVERLTNSPVGLLEVGSVFEGRIMKALMFQQSYDVATWSNFSRSLATVLYGSEAERIETLTILSNGGALKGPPPKGIMDVNWAIHCGDRIPRTNNYEEIAPALGIQYSTSYYVGGMNAVTQAICAQWPWKAKEVYQGDFRAKTKHPILVMSNSLDGQTPLASARNMSAGFEGAVILENDGVGHGAFSFPSTCVAKHVIEYWVDGSMPVEGTICSAEFGTFEKKTWFELLASMETGTAIETKSMSARKWLEKQL